MKRPITRSAVAIVSAASALFILAGPTTTASAAPATCGGRTATIVGSSTIDDLTGTAGNDVIAGLGGSDRIDGRGGNDRICGGYGADQLTGGGGSDKIFGGQDDLFVNDEGIDERIGDRLRGGAGPDRLVPGLDTRPADEVTHDLISWETSPQRVHIDLVTGVATGEGRDQFTSVATWVVGSAYADVIEGGPAGDLVDGWGGPDRIRTYGGDDRVNGGSGSDRIETQRGDDQVYAGSGVDVVYAGHGDDEISSNAGADRLYGQSGSDTIDNFDKVADAARMYGGGGPDLLIAQLANVPGQTQVVAGGSGDRDRLNLFTTALNPDPLPAEGTWNMSTGRLVFNLDGPVLATVIGFESADLSTYGATWSIEGTAGPDLLTAGGTANTSFRAMAGNDSFRGSNQDLIFDGSDHFNGGGGRDRSLGMGTGDDTCIDVEVFVVPDDCETVVP